MKFGVGISLTNVARKTGQRVSLLSTDTNVPAGVVSIDYEYLKTNTGQDFMTSAGLRFVVKEN